MKEIIYLKAIREALTEEMRRDDRVILLGEDVGASGGAFGAALGLFKEFGEKRVIDTPIVENSIVGMGVGAAIGGLKAIVEIMFIDFIALGMDEIANYAAKVRYMYGGQYKVPLVIRTTAGGGLNAGAHHSQSLEAWFTHIPGLKVVYAATPYDVKGLLKSAIRDENPILFIEHKQLRVSGQIPEDDYTVPLGKADVKRQGSDVTIVTWGPFLFKVLAAADKLAAEGISAEVIDLRTLVPLDLETVIGSVKKTGKLVVAHEAVKLGGFGAEVAASVCEQAFDYLDAPIKRVGGNWTPIPWGPLESTALPQEADVVAAVKSLTRS